MTNKDIHNQVVSICQDLRMTALEQDKGTINAVQRGLVFLVAEGNTLISKKLESLPRDFILTLVEGLKKEKIKATSLDSDALAKRLNKLAKGD